MNDIFFESLQKRPCIPGMEDCHAILARGRGCQHDFSLHWHHACEIVLVTEGTVNYTVDGIMHTSTAGSFHLINSQKIHAAVNGIPNSEICALVLLISDSYRQMIFPEDHLCDFEIQPDSDAYQLILKDMWDMFHSLERMDEMTNLVSISHMSHILEVLYQHCRKINTNCANGYSKEVIRYVGEHYHEKISVEDIAKRVSLQPNYFCRTFKKETGQTFKYYLNHIRLDNALFLLNSGKYTVLECALQVGFSSEKQMIDWCKKIHRTTPARFIKARK